MYGYVTQNLLILFVLFGFMAQQHNLGHMALKQEANLSVTNLK
jgi:hypothetical protein